MRQRGVAYLWLLLTIFLVSLLIGKSLDIYSTQRQREREMEVLTIGEQYRQAIEAYYLNSPGTHREYPASINGLLRDPRHLTLYRYLRRAYPDPLTGRPWEVVPAPGGGIMGVYSSAETRPIKQSGFPEAESGFENATHYSDWKFIYSGVPNDPGAASRLQ